MHSVIFDCSIDTAFLLAENQPGLPVLFNVGVEIADAPNCTETMASPRFRHIPWFEPLPFQISWVVWTPAPLRRSCNMLSWSRESDSLKCRVPSSTILQNLFPGIPCTKVNLWCYIRSWRKISRLSPYNPLSGWRPCRGHTVWTPYCTHIEEKDID